jgi:hypothetical protein
VLSSLGFLEGESSVHEFSLRYQFITLSLAEYRGSELDPMDSHLNSGSVDPGALHPFPNHSLTAGGHFPRNLFLEIPPFLDWVIFPGGTPGLLRGSF